MNIYENQDQNFQYQSVLLDQKVQFKISVNFLVHKELKRQNNYVKIGL